MKKILVKIIVALLIVYGLAACLGRKDSGSETLQNSFSFSELEDMEEITVEGNTVTVVLLQEGPLPYRWDVTRQSACVTLIKEYEVGDPYDFSIASRGSAPEYHVFVFELAESDRAELEFYNCWVVEPENLAEANGSRMFCLKYMDGQWEIQ